MVQHLTVSCDLVGHEMLKSLAIPQNHLAVFVALILTKLTSFQIPQHYSCKQAVLVD